MTEALRKNRIISLGDPKIESGWSCWNLIIFWHLRRRLLSYLSWAPQASEHVLLLKPASNNSFRQSLFNRLQRSDKSMRSRGRCGWLENPDFYYIGRGVVYRVSGGLGGICIKYLVFSTIPRLIGSRKPPRGPRNSLQRCWNVYNHHTN